MIAATAKRMERQIKESRLGSLVVDPETKRKVLEGSKERVSRHAYRDVFIEYSKSTASTATYRGAFNDGDDFQENLYEELLDVTEEDKD